MSDERDRVRETPAPDGPPRPEQPRGYETRAPRLEHRAATDAGAMFRGMLVAVGLVAAFMMIEAAAMVAVMAASVGRQAAAIAFYVALLVAIAGFAAAVLVARRLPRAERASFWAMGTVCVASVAIFLVGVCGVRPPRVGG
jgi:hypothetical protein